MSKLGQTAESRKMQARAVGDLKRHIAPSLPCDSMQPEAQHANSVSYNLTPPPNVNGNNKEHYKCGKSLAQIMGDIDGGTY